MGVFRTPLRGKAEGRIRTDDLLITNELLCQLSYFGNSKICKQILEDGVDFENVVLFPLVRNKIPTPPSIMVYTESDLLQPSKPKENP